MEIREEFETIYTKKTKNRKKCRWCGKFVADGEKVVMRKIVDYYLGPRGKRNTVKWTFTHIECEINSKAKYEELKKKEEAKLDELKELAKNSGRKING